MVNSQPLPIANHDGIKSSIRDIINHHYPDFHPIMIEALLEATTKDLTHLVWRFKDMRDITE